MQISQIQLLYQLTPIWLRDGVATNINGGVLPILSILNYEVFAALNNLQNFQDESPVIQNSVADDWNFENAFAIFQPAPGGSLVKQSIAEYPWANLSVAANAIVREALSVSMIMLTPMKEKNSWALKQSRMSTLKSVLDAHNNLGGTYIVFTPAFIYDNMCMEDLTDISTSSNPLPQNTWRWNFRQPLVSLQDLYGAENNLISKLSAGLPTTSLNTAVQTALGQAASVVNIGFGAGATVPTISASPMSTLPPPTPVSAVPIQ
jgi:hypothetical protein